MVKPIGKKPIGATQGPQAAAQKPSAPLKKLVSAVEKFVHKRGHSLLGAGSPPQITDRPPQKSSQRVSQAVNDTLPQTRKRTAH